MADDKKVEEPKKVEDRSAYIQKNMPEGFVKKATSFISNIGDTLGFTQKKEYEGKTREEIAKKPVPEKKRAGGMVGSASKRADGCAQRGKTRGKMV
jgi:hypothetical protein